jgi:5-methylthioadenosine/S-adenosylhomocysteine deaminase
MRGTQILIAVLLSCATSALVRGQDMEPYALHGTLVTPTTVLPDGTLLVVGEKIGAVGLVVNLPTDAKILETDSFIFPGLIDLHNHLTWNLFPRWPAANWKPTDWDPSKKFGARYDWQQLKSYQDELNGPHGALLDEGWGCEMNRFGEVKAIAGGSSSSVGSLGPEKCVEGLARNLDFYSGFYQADAFKLEKLVYNIFPLEMTVNEADGIRSGLASGQINAFIIHIGEGAAGDASVAREFKMFVANGFLRPGVSIVHGVTLKTAQFQEMNAHGVGLIWSPRSNLELYGNTTDVASAKNSGVVIAIAPDWSPSGSSGMIEELKYAGAWNARHHPKIFDDADLVKMATTYPARLAGLSEKTGSLSRGYFADLLLLRRKGADPYAALLHATPLDVRLVVVDGRPVYGDKDLMELLLPQRTLEPVEICGKRDEKVLYLGSDASLGGLPKTWKETTNHLRGALQQWNIKLADLAEVSECSN